MKKGKLIDCPKCGRFTSDFTIEYLGDQEKRFLHNLNGEAIYIDDSEDLMLNTCNNCGYKEKTLPLDNKE